MKKLFTFLMLLLCVASSVWADGYTPSSDEVIILNEVYSASATTAGYSTHTAVAWGGTASASNKQAGDPNNNGAATSSDVACFSAKGNGKGKNITISISGCSKIIVYHESHSSRYVELRSESKEGTLIGQGSTSTYYSEIDLDGTKSYSIFLHGTNGSSDQDFYVYAVKLIKYVKKDISSQALSGVKVNGSALTENAETAGYSVSGSTITLTDVAYVVPTNVTLTNHITYTDNTTEDKNVAVTFEAAATGGFWNGTATIGSTTYNVKVPYSSQSVTGVTINGTAISDTDLATLTSTKAVSIDGSSLNGIGMIGVTLSGGTANVTRTNSGNDVVFKFTINASDEYTVTVTNLNRNYTTFGNVVYYSKDGTNADGANTNAVTANGITFAMVDENKTLQYGSGKVTIGGAEYTPLKLSTGSAVNVTFPEGKKATKVKVYGWSANGNGKMYLIQETSDADGKTVADLSADIYYATNTDKDIYPSVYEYKLDNWESMYFSCGGSDSQPFVVMDFQFSDTEIPGPADPIYSTAVTEVATINSSGTSTSVVTPSTYAAVITTSGNTNSNAFAGNSYGLKLESNSGEIKISLPEGASNASVTLLSSETFTKLKINGASTDVTVEGNATNGYTTTLTIADDFAGDEYTIAKGSGSPVVYKITLSYVIGRENEVTLTTTASMQGWRSFYDAENSYTVDDKTKVYVATEVKTEESVSKVKLTEIEAVPAGMAVLLKTTNQETTSTDGHYLMTLTKDTEVQTPDIISLLKVTPYEGNWYRLGSKSGEVGFFPFNATGAAAGIVVLNIDSSNAQGARGLTLSFADDETTGISNVNDNVNLNKVVFDLQGRRVAKPTKGMYIVNGKKVIIK